MFHRHTSEYTHAQASHTCGAHVSKSTSYVSQIDAEFHSCRYIENAISIAMAIAYARTHKLIKCVLRWRKCRAVTILVSAAVTAPATNHFAYLNYRTHRFISFSACIWPSCTWTCCVASISTSPSFFSAIRLIIFSHFFRCNQIRAQKWRKNTYSSSVYRSVRAHFVNNEWTVTCQTKKSIQFVTFKHPNN